MRSVVAPGLRPAVFLDRDGTLVEERDYLSDPADLVFVPGAVEALRRLEDAGFARVIVTNQSGIARGLYSLEEYRAVASRLNELLEEAGASVDGTWYCPHHPDYTGACDCRKPDTGMHREAAEALGLDLPASWYVGDKEADVRPASVLGGRGILVRTGYGLEWEDHVGDDVAVVDDLAEAVRLIVDAQGPGR